MHELRTSMVLPISLDEAWAFFSVPDNLDDITLPDMGFEILTDNEKRTMLAKSSVTVSVLVQHSHDLGHRDTHYEDRTYFVMSSGLVPTPCGIIRIISKRWKVESKWTTSFTTNSRGANLGRCLPVGWCTAG